MMRQLYKSKPFTKRRYRAFTLAEMTVVIALFGLFSTTALASLNLTLRHWRTVSIQTDVYSSCRMAINTISKELRQGMPNPAPGFQSYYYEDINTPSTDVIAVSTPNIKNQTATQLIFTEANPADFSPTSTFGFTATDPKHYRRVRYYVSQNKLHREMKTYNSSGAVSKTSDDILTSADSITFLVTCLSPTNYKIEFSCSKTVGSNTKEASLSSNVIVLGS